MIFLLVCLAALGISEFLTITILLTPLPQSTQADWLIGTLLIAPFMAVAMVWLFGVAVWVSAGIMWLCRCITGNNRPQHHPSDGSCVNSTEGIVPATTHQWPGKHR